MSAADLYICNFALTPDDGVHERTIRLTTDNGFNGIDAATVPQNEPISSYFFDPDLQNAFFYVRSLISSEFMGDFLAKPHFSSVNFYSR